MGNQLADGIDWVGYVDWQIRDFHSYVTSRGATYNAYLIRDEKTVLIDTVKLPYADNLIANIRELLGDRKLDYIVINHAEPDHAGSLPKLLELYPEVTVICSKKCLPVLESYNPGATGWKVKLVGSGDRLSTGRRSLAFLETPMVHWPESIFTYVPEEKLLFSMDAFGQHYASSARFDDEVDLNEVMQEARRYYANIVMLYGSQIAKTLEEASGLDIQMIAPSHGVIWRSHLSTILSAYREWVTCTPKPKVLVIYDSMWESTRMMAEAIVGGAVETGAEVKLLFVRGTGLTEIATEVLDAAVIAVGSATLNMGMMPMMGAALIYLQGLRPQGKAGFSFGSYGWGKGAPEAINEILEGMKFEILREPIRAKWRPGPDILAECREAGILLGEKALARSKD